jgi:hypothetical protein
MIISDATTWSITYDDTNSKARANKILIIQTSLTIITYDRQKYFYSTGRVALMSLYKFKE